MYYDDPNYRESEPDFDIKRENLPENEYSIIAWNKPPNIVREDVGGEKTLIEFPMFVLKTDVRIDDRNEAFHELWINARRIRNYLSFFFHGSFPLMYKMIGKTLLVTSSFNSSHFFPTMVRIADKSDCTKIGEIFNTSYNRVKELLTKLKINSALDIAINFYGTSLWSEDHVDSFLYRWRVMEIIADLEIKRLSDIDLGELHNLMSKADIERLFNERLRAVDKIKITSKKLIPGTDVSKFGFFNELRNKASHGNLSTSIHKEIVKNLETLTISSHRLLLAKVNYPRASPGASWLET